MSRILRVAVLEDEPLARRRLERLIAAQADLQLVGSYPHPLEARAAMPDVDLLFVDIEMPFENGFAWLDSLSPDRLRAVIVVTAHSSHALPALRREAVDFLLKPYDEIGFGLALAKARRRLQGEQLLALLGESRAPQAQAVQLLCLPLPDGSERLLAPTEIDWIAVQDKLLRLHAGSHSYEVRGTLADFERRLAGQGFVRVHRGLLINRRSITSLRRGAHGDARLRLRDGSELPLSRRYADRLAEGLL